MPHSIHQLQSLGSWVMTILRCITYVDGHFDHELGHELGFLSLSLWSIEQSRYFLIASRNCSPTGLSWPRITVRSGKTHARTSAGSDLPCGSTRLCCKLISGLADLHSSFSGMQYSGRSCSKQYPFPCRAAFHSTFCFLHLCNLQLRTLHPDGASSWTPASPDL